MNLEQKVDSVLSRERNAVITHYADYDEILVFNHNFTDFTGVPREDDASNTKRARRFKRVGVDEYAVAHDNTDMFTLERSLKQTHKRAKDKFMRYAKNRQWKYFITMTIDQEHYAHDDRSVRGYFRDWIRKMKATYKDMAYIFSLEWQENGTLHFHGLCDNLPRELFTRAISPHTGKPLTNKGRAVYNMNCWTYGFTTCFIIGNKLVSSLKTVNYCSKYMDKDLAFDYNQRVFYRSDNLVLPTTETAFLDLIPIDECVWLKSHDFYNVYLRYNNSSLVPLEADMFSPLIDKRKTRDIMSLANMRLGGLVCLDSIF